MRDCIRKVSPVTTRRRNVIRVLICGLTVFGLHIGYVRLVTPQITENQVGKPPTQIRSQRSPALLKGVDHFFVYSTEPEPLFKFFRDTLGLPQVWDFKSFGDFASGGVWMGNVEFEVVTWKPPPGTKPPTEFKGIAFEPVGYTNRLIEELDRRAIQHEKAEPTLMKDKQGREFVGWINTGLDGPNGVPPSNVSIFAYDSTSKEEKAARNERSIAALNKVDGGPLGVVAVKELAIGVVDLKITQAKWRNLVDRPDQQSGNLYRFSHGPAIRLFAASTDGFKRIVLQVRSLRKAREFLAQRNLLGKTRDRVYIDPLAMGGLEIILEQRYPVHPTRRLQSRGKGYAL
ncbi:MAG: hypothetical protein ABJB40_10645 [Acidobacteriota bacterium]